MGYMHNSLLTVTGAEALLTALRTEAFGAFPASEQEVAYTDSKYGPVEIYLEVLWEELTTSRLQLVFSSQSIVPAPWLQKLRERYPSLAVGLFSVEDADERPAGFWDLNSPTPEFEKWPLQTRLKLVGQLRSALTSLEEKGESELPLEKVLKSLKPNFPEERFYCAVILELPEVVAIEEALEDVASLYEELEDAIASAASY